MQKVVVSLTSYPERIHVVYRVIESLFKQIRRPDEIVLWLSTLEFSHQYDDLPENLKRMIGKNGFHVKWVEKNIKSHKKYFYVLQDCDSVVITVDDDKYYAKTMIQTLMESYRKHPHAISARSVRMILRKDDCMAPYHMWDGHVTEYIGMERKDLCAIGASGILYPPRCAKKTWFNEEHIKSYAENQDDLWLKYNELMDGVPVVYAGMQEKDILIEQTQNNALHIKNIQDGENDLCIKKIAKKMQEKSKEKYGKWFKSLMSKEEYFTEKALYYKTKITAICCQYNHEDIYIYGAGRYAHALLEFINKCGYQDDIKAFLVTEEPPNKYQNDEIKTMFIRELEKDKSFTVICGVGEKYKNEVRENLVKFRNHTWIELDMQDLLRLVKEEVK